MYRISNLCEDQQEVIRHPSKQRNFSIQHCDCSLSIYRKTAAVRAIKFRYVCSVNS